MWVKMKLNQPLLLSFAASFALACGSGKSHDAASGDGADESSEGDSGTTADDAESESESNEESAGDEAPKYDLDSNPDIPEGCGGDGGEIEFSHIWIANSLENTVSKINTMTVQEEGRYKVHPAIDVAAGMGGSPSRTSVNLNGDMVVANRCDIKSNPPEGCGGVTMIAAQEENCVDQNMDDVIQTSTGPNDVLPWGEDECVLWHQPFQAASNRPVAWTSGEKSEDGCRWEDPQVWTATSDDMAFGTANVYLLNEVDGSIDDMVHIPEWQGDTLAVYGGAVDSQNDFWFIGGYSEILGEVRIDDMTYDIVPMPNDPYGIIVDTEDRPWIAGFNIKRYDPDTDTWTELPCMQNGCSTVVQGPDGWIWVTESARIYKVDPDTVQVVDIIDTDDVPDLSGTKGISVDVEGFLWVLQQGTKAWKIDRDSHDFEVFNNTTSMYTYSDMTGFGLKNVAPAG